MQPKASVIGVRSEDEPGQVCTDSHCIALTKAPTSNAEFARLERSMPSRMKLACRAKIGSDDVTEKLSATIVVVGNSGTREAGQSEKVSYFVALMRLMSTDVKP